MSTKKGSFKEKFYRDIVPVVYGIGASTVIIGALFKLENWKGASTMLILGLGTEAVLFLLGAFEPKEIHLDWTKVYPELSEGNDEAVQAIPANKVKKTAHVASGPIGEKLEELFAQAKIDGMLIGKLGEGMHKIAEYTKSMSSVPLSHEATAKYISSLDKASGALEAVFLSQKSTSDALKDIVSVAESSKEYKNEMKALTESLGELNKIYKGEVKDIELKFKSIGDAYSGMVVSLGSLKHIGTETEKFKSEFVQLSEKISALNKIYGNMLTAWKN